MYTSPSFTSSKFGVITCSRWTIFHPHIDIGTLHASTPKDNLNFLKVATAFIIIYRARWVSRICDEPFCQMPYYGEMMDLFEQTNWEKERWEQDRISSESVNILLTDYSQRPCTLTLRAFYSLFIMYASSSFVHYWFRKAWIPRNNNLYWDLKKGSSLEPIGISESCQLARVEWSFFSWRVYTHHQRTRERNRERDRE